MENKTEPRPIQKDQLYDERGFIGFCQNDEFSTRKIAKNITLEFLKACEQDGLIAPLMTELQQGKLISKLKFTDEELTEIDARTKTDLAVFEQKRLKEIEKNDRRKRKLREDLTYLRTNKLTLLKTGAYSPEDFLMEENKLNDELLAIQNEEQASDISMHEVVKDVVKLSELLKDAEVYYSFAETAEKEQIARIIFSELSLYENTLKYKVKNGFAALESRFVASCDPTESRTPLSTLRRSRPNR